MLGKSGTALCIPVPHLAACQRFETLPDASLVSEGLVDGLLATTRYSSLGLQITGLQTPLFNRKMK